MSSDEQQAAPAPSPHGHQHAEPSAATTAAATTTAAAAHEPLTEALAQMRSEADRIADLGTGTEQVEAAESFAEQAGTLDQQIASAARKIEDSQHR